MARREQRIARRTLLGGAAVMAGAVFVPSGARAARSVRTVRTGPRPAAITPPSYGPLNFYLLGTPVRVYDSRPGFPPGTSGDTALARGTVRTIDVSFVLGDSELPTGVDTASDGVLMNLTVVSTVGAGFVKAWADDGSEPPTSAVNWSGSGAVVANGVISMHAGGLIKAKVDGATGCAAHLIVDVIGYLAATA